MNNRKKINIGFDIGITSVGWAIVDEDNNIVDRGVRLFKELKDPKTGKLKNQEKREKRSLRRTIRRKINRKDDFIKLVLRKYRDVFGLKNISTNNKQEFAKAKDYFLKTIIPANSTNVNLMELIIKGLKQELKPLETLRILYNYMNHRGYSYITYEQWMENNDDLIKKISCNEKYIKFCDWYKNHLIENENKPLNDIVDAEIDKLNISNDGFKTKKEFLSKVKTYIDKKDFLGKTPTEIQLMQFNKYGFIRGEASNVDFSVHDWTDEVKKFMKNQKYLSDSFQDEYINLFQRIREFAKGPGSEKSPSDYGVFTKGPDGKIKEYNNLWEKLIGKCSVYTNENRANKKSSSAEISNLLSQLNTLVITDNLKNDKLSKEEKQKIIFNAIANNKKVDLKFLQNILSVKVTDFAKFPTKQSVKKSAFKHEAETAFEPLENTKIIYSVVSNKWNVKNYNDLISNLDKFNKIIDIFSQYPEQFEKVEKELKRQLELEDSLIKMLIEKSNKLDCKSTSSMSYKALNEYINDEIVTKGKTVNQKFKNIIEENERKKFNFGDSKYINTKCLDDEVISPTTKCSFRETLKVFNKILKRYVYNGDVKYSLNNIIMEMPTEWNSVDERKKESEIQLRNAEYKRIVKENYGYESNNAQDKVTRKLVLFHQQDGKDILTGLPLDVNQVINNPSYTQIDHIIPYSISYDDSLNNRILVSNKTNQDKGKRVPKQYLPNDKYYAMENLWKELYKNEDAPFKSLKKYENLTFVFNEDDEKAQIGFIGRNLSDTRYACRAANQALRSWIEKMKSVNNTSLSDDLENVKVINVNGKFSQRFRREKFLNIPKNRDDFSHHAIDATICALIGNTDYVTMGNLVWLNKVNEETGEVQQKSFFGNHNWKKMRETVESQINWNGISQLVQNSNVKFSFKLTKKNNYGFWNDTIYSMKKNTETGNVDKYSNIFLRSYDTFNETESAINNLKKIYIKNEQICYPDKKMWMDLMNAFEEGKKEIDKDSSLKNKNPFNVYMEKYYSLHPEEKNASDDKSIILVRHNSKTNSSYKYKVSKIKLITSDALSFLPRDKNNLEKFEINKKFGAYSGIEWKEMRLFLDNKGKYRLIKISIDLFENNKIINNKYIELLNENDISNENANKYYSIHYGTLLINKTNDKDLLKVVGQSYSQNKLEIKPVYKSQKEHRVFMAMSSLMNEYDFCTADELGNITRINIDNFLK